MGLRYDNQEHGNCFFVTTSFANHRKTGNISGVYKQLADNMNFYLIKYSAKLLGYVFMPSHIHFVIFLEGKQLSGFMRDFKKYSSQKILKRFTIENQVWENGYDRVAIWNPSVVRTKLTYIHNNPVKAGLADIPEEWEWSSAADYINNRKGILPIMDGLDMSGVVQVLACSFKCFCCIECKR